MPKSLILGRVPLRKAKSEIIGGEERRRSVIEAYRLVSTIGQAEEGNGWEVEVTRALVVTRSVFTNNAPSLSTNDTHDNESDHHPRRHSKIPRPTRAPFSSLSNTLTDLSMPSAPSYPSSTQSTSTASSADKGGRNSPRPIVTPRRTAAAATTRSFSSIPPPSRLDTPQSLLSPPTLALIEPTPDPSPITPTATRRVHNKSEPETPSSALRGRGPGLEVPQIQKSWSSGSGKRKADDAEITPPKEQQQKDSRTTTFAPEPRTHRASASSHAPSSYRRKRARLSVPSSDSSNPPSRPASRTAMSSVAEKDGGNSLLNAKNTGSWSSKKSGKSSTAEKRASSSTNHTRTNSYSRSQQAQSATLVNHAGSSSHNNSNTLYQHPHGAPSRRSLSQASMPISALISPHAPSITHSGTFHMRDPRKPAPVQPTPWSLSLPYPLFTSRGGAGGGGGEEDEGSWIERGGSPLCSWLFFFGFLVFPVWWLSWVIGVPKTRRLSEVEKGTGVVLDDPQLEHDARSWRTRCRVMSGISVVTYIPFIVLVIVFAR